jgi:hypothetical protein
MVLDYVQTEAMLVEIDVIFALMELIQVVGVNYYQMAVMEIAVRIAILTLIIAMAIAIKGMECTITQVDTHQSQIALTIIPIWKVLLLVLSLI